MRSHFVKCLEQGKMEYFPQKTHSRVPIGNRCLSFKVYCKCRMPNDPSKAMIKCDKCKAWMHKEWHGNCKFSSSRGYLVL